MFIYRVHEFINTSDMMKDKFLLLLVLLVTAVALLVATAPVNVMAAYNTTDLDVNVSTLSQITLSPTYLNWTGVTLGTMGGYKNITITNTGSVNVTNIYSWVDTITDESERPYGSGDSTKYAAGSVLTIENEGESEYFFLGRLEWNWTSDIPSHSWSAVTNATAWGYFRNLTNDYVWVLGNGTAGLCNNSGAQFAIETDVDTGTIDTRTPVNVVSLTDGDDSWSYAAISAGTLAGHCVAASWNCSKIFIYNFDKRNNFTVCANSNYLSTADLTPGKTITVRVDAWVPRGIPAGNLSTATLTVEAS